MIKFLQALWLFFNGKKTVIGSFLLTLSMVLQEAVIAILEYDEPWLHKVIKLLNYIGGFLATTGLMHKYGKMKSDS